MILYGFECVVDISLTDDFQFDLFQTLVGLKIFFSGDFSGWRISFVLMLVPWTYSNGVFLVGLSAAFV